MQRLSVAMDGPTAAAFTSHLMRDDGQEELCFAVWKPSSGLQRTTALLQHPIFPGDGERQVHGNVSFNPGYALRAAQLAARTGGGLAFVHSHPGSRGWQALTGQDSAAESRIANTARELTGLPLLGLTLGEDGAWSARLWSGAGRNVVPLFAETVRVIGDGLGVTFNDALVPAPVITDTQTRTVHTWGERTQATIARLRVAVAGAGSVGMAIVDALCRTGVQHVGVFEFDTVERVNIDRLRGATALDAYLCRPKAHVAARLVEEGSTAAEPRHEFYELSICEPEGLIRLLDYDVVFSCVDRPWPRHVLNTIAFSDLVPIVEGGLSAFRNADDTLRNAYWRSTVVRPSRPCLACLGQYDPSVVQLERDGSLDDPSYIANLPRVSPLRRRENVSALTVSVAAALLQQFIAFVAMPSGFFDPGPLIHNLRDHAVVRDGTVCAPDCPYASSLGCGDARLDPTARHFAAERARECRASIPAGIRLIRLLDDSKRSI